MSRLNYLTFAKRITAVAGAAAVIFVATVPAYAQSTPLSLSQRVTRLEQQAQHNQGSVALVNQIQALQSQNRQLQGQIEELQHQIQQLKDSSKAQYIDLDSRLRRVDGGAEPTGAASSEAPAAAQSTAAPADSVATASSVAPDTAAPAKSGSAATADQPQAQSDYDTAFKALRGGDFAASARGFRAFIDQYPDNSLVPNAYYWLGESYYITQNYPVALTTFKKLLQAYPDNDKSSGALLKVGYCQYELKHPDQAKATLKSVIAKYPGSDVAKLAQRRLQDIELQSQPLN